MQEDILFKFPTSRNLLEGYVWIHYCSHFRKIMATAVFTVMTINEIIYPSGLGISINSSGSGDRSFNDGHGAV